MPVKKHPPLSRCMTLLPRTLAGMLLLAGNDGARLR
jgi:hypothetical protein